jgi:hypothetical protein
MPYQGKEARERLRWMTLAEAVDHVVLTEHCERVVALSEIRLALGEGDIPGRWAASPLPAGFYPLGLPPIFSFRQRSNRSRVLEPSINFARSRLSGRRSGRSSTIAAPSFART